MNKRLKVVLSVVLVLALIGGAVGYFMWNKPHRKVEDEKGIEVTAAQLVSEYSANELEANKKYLDKAIQVTGTVKETGVNQEGNTTVTLASDDLMTGVMCTLKQKSAGVSAGSSVTIKGICSGMLSDVRLSDAVVVK